MPRSSRNFFTVERGAHSHYVVDGEKFFTGQEVYKLAVSRGYTGSLCTIKSRLHRGATTWAELLRTATQTEATAKRKESQQRKRDEMHNLCVELDKRKSELGYAY